MPPAQFDASPSFLDSVRIVQDGLAGLDAKPAIRETSRNLGSQLPSPLNHATAVEDSPAVVTRAEDKNPKSNLPAPRTASYAQAMLQEALKTHMDLGSSIESTPKKVNVRSASYLRASSAMSPPFNIRRASTSNVSGSPAASVPASPVSATRVRPFNLSRTNMAGKDSMSSEELQVMISKQKLQEEMMRFQRIKEHESKKKFRPHSAPTPAAVSPDPFELESVRRHKAKMEQIAQQLAKEALEQQKAREFVATPLEKVAKVVQKKHVPPKVVRPCTVHKPFNIHTEARHKYKEEVVGPEKARQEQLKLERLRAMQEEDQARAAEELKRLRHEMEFKARKCTVTTAQPFKPKSPVVETTKPVPFSLRTNDRVGGKVAVRAA